jgi:hypothetical protein
MTETQLLQILRWAAGAPEDVSSIQEVDEDALVSLIAAHNLFSRFFNRLQAQRPPWMTRALSIKAFSLNRYAKETVQRQIAALREIVQAMPADAGPVIPIKGMSLYALTGETDNLRASGDIDLFAQDPECLWRTLTRLGYATEEKQDDGSHYAIMHRSGVQIEIHRYFPAWAYPSGMTGDMRPSSHPGVWMQPFADLGETQIHSQDIAEDAAPGVAPQTHDLTLPSPAVMALLLCLHAFRHYVEGQALDSPIVRLCELADVRDLVRHPRFQEKQFQALVSRFSAHDAVRFVQHLLRFYLKTDLFNPQEPVRDDQADETMPLPLRLSFWSGWAAPCTPNEMLRQLNPKSVFDRLEPNVVAADGGWYSAFSPAYDGATALRPLPRVIVRSPLREQIPVRLSARWETDRLLLNVEILHPCPPGYRYQVLLYYPYKFQGTRPAGFEVPYSNVHWAEVGYDEQQQILLSSDCSAVSIGTSEHGSSAHIPFPWADLPPVFQSDDLVPMMALVMKIRQERSARGHLYTDTMMIIPLHIVRC